MNGNLTCASFNGGGTLRERMEEQLRRTERIAELGTLD